MREKRISVCMATKNEEASVGKVMEDIHKFLGPETEVVIVDSSRDRTPEIARNAGAKVIAQPPLGYGRALAAAIESAGGDLIVTTDCDGTYPMELVPRMVRMAESADIVSGSRLLGKGIIREMPLFNQLGNRMFAILTNVLFGSNFSDVTTGLRVFRRDAIRKQDWTENIGLSIELLVRPHMGGFKIVEAPIPYTERIGQTKLNPIKGGYEMLKSIIKLRMEYWRRPAIRR